MDDSLKKAVKILLGLCLIAGGCTNNPFYDEKINTDKNLTFTGNVRLGYSDNYSDIAVWMEGFDVFVRTDANGNFKINMPLPPYLQPGGGITGSFRVFYYMDNYKIRFSTVIVQHGEFVPNVASLDKNARINDHFVLQQLLDVQTAITPLKVKSNYNGNFKVSIRAENKVDSVLVSGYFTNKDDILAALFIRNKESGRVSKYLTNNNAISEKTVVIDSLTNWNLNVNLNNYNLPAGNYEIFPFLKVVQENIPQQLLYHFGNKALSFDATHLNIPFRQQAGALQIVDVDN